MMKRSYNLYAHSAAQHLDAPATPASTPSLLGRFAKSVTEAARHIGNRAGRSVDQFGVDIQYAMPVFAEEILRRKS